MLLPNGRINAGENQIHLTGIAWCGGYGKPPEDGPERTVFITTLIVLGERLPPRPVANACTWLGRIVRIGVSPKVG